MDTKEEKTKARAEAKRILESMTDERIRESDAKILKGIFENYYFRNARSIFVYVSTDKEPDTLKLIDAALEDGKAVYVPKCEKKPYMKAVRINSRDELKPGFYGIPEPVSDEGFDGNIDIAIVPCLAASSDGRRLGHGGGYYDCFLNRRIIYKICICRKELINENLPTDAFDVMMDEVITD